MDKTYHLVLVIENETTLQSSDLIINDRAFAEKFFSQKIKETQPGVEESTIQAALDEGWFQSGNVVVMYTEPFNIFGKE